MSILCSETGGINEKITANLTCIVFLIMLDIREDNHLQVRLNPGLCGGASR